MNKQEFLAAVRAKLGGLPQGDVEPSLDYYSEMIDDRMEDGLSEEEAVAAMGGVEDIAAQILRETPRPPAREGAAPSRPRLRAVGSETRTYEVVERFSHIRIDEVEADIRLVPSQDGACRVVCAERDGISHAVTVQGDTLTITRTDERKWYERVNVSWGPTPLTLYLPAGEYGALELKTLSGDMVIPGGFTFTQAELQSTSGNVDYSAPTGHRLFVKTVSGDLRVHDQAVGLAVGVLQTQTTSGDTELSHVKTDSLQASSTSGDIRIAACQAAGGMTVETASGDAELEYLNAASLRVRSSSGDMGLSHVIAAGPMEVSTGSGDIKLERCDAETLRLSSSSGDVSGVLLSEKRFVTRTTSGTVRVPDGSPDGGRCEAATTSGDITLHVRPG